MRKYYFLFIIFLFILFVSCLLEGENVSPISSEMSATFGQNSFSTKDNVFEMTLNVDQNDFASGYITINAKHSFAKDVNTEDLGFEFFCNNAELLYSSKNSCMIDYVNLSELGSYIITAKSKYSSEFDKVFAINLTSNLKAINVTYKIQDSYVKEGLSYTDEMKEGTITSLVNEITLCAGAVYDFTVIDNSGNGASIKNINVSTSNSCIFFRGIEGEKGELCCKKGDDQSSNLTFRVGKTNITLSVKVNIKNLSSSSIEEVETQVMEVDKVISLNPNQTDNLDKHYDYQINITDVTDNVSDLLFCLDYQDWSEDNENSYLDNEYFIVPTNVSPSWAKRSVLSYVFDNQTKYKVEVDGVLKTLSITPLKETIFTSKNHGVKNLHTYIYTRYSTDPANTYRWKWRVMVGGELEGIDLFDYKGSGEPQSIPGNTIDIKAGDEVGWIFRAIYRPSTTTNHNTLWYLSDLESSSTYTLDNGAVVKLPVPASKDSDINKTLQFSGAVDSEKSFGNLTVYYYRNDTSTLNGISDLWTTYNNVGADCRLVCVNLDTGLYNTIKLKNHISTTVTVKGVAEDSSFKKIEIPQSVTTLSSSDKSKSVTISTNYNDETEQCFPKTVRNSDTTRTFFMPVDSRLVLTLETTFNIENITITGDRYTNDCFSGAFTQIEGNKRKAEIVIATKYFETDDKDKKDFPKDKCKTDYAIYSIKLNNIETLIKINCIVYGPD